MCSKSANYCFASRAKTDGLILLCDVRLNEVHHKCSVRCCGVVPGGGGGGGGICCGRVEHRAHVVGDLE